LLKAVCHGLSGLFRLASWRRRAFTPAARSRSRRAASS
jgi:hypothetical protein